MQPYQDRVVEEYNELLDKSLKLIEFMDSETFGELPERSRKLLNAQLSAIGSYLFVLDERINSFTDLTPEFS